MIKLMFLKRVTIESIKGAETMEQMIAYIKDKDCELIFNPTNEEKVIGLILGNTEPYKELDEKHEGEFLPVEWIERQDDMLAKFSLSMFTRTKKLMLVDIQYEEFLVLWEDYTHSLDYYIQVANYMLNSDDYTSGDRYQLKGEEKEANFRESNMPQNMQKLSQNIQVDGTIGGNYLNKVSRIGSELQSLLVGDEF